MTLTVYYSSVSGSTKMRKEQDRIFSILDSQKIYYIKVDISQSSDDKDKMRKLASDKTALPPQICNGDSYCGDYAAFDAAVDNEQLKSFLQA
ncbi:SH3 domain-binding glutamic acid-rich-like protein 3 [Salarias fasciatus]|uniref:SH3 domain-binding glutamic acid-rich-like protein 3 n=1 Tax=Salarias fasciatus TaxID=181472 RepID=A0A672FC75_SALFA|nr:SH3 domain-binding glutamic acid-rich-like protein 3 [Salarias fasciatus]